MHLQQALAWTAPNGREVSPGLSGSWPCVQGEAYERYVALVIVDRVRLRRPEAEGREE